MAFLPRLPTFTTELVWYQYDPTTHTWEEQTPITGQVYTPQRSQDDDTGGLLYFMYPKESDLLHDTYDYGSDGNADVIAIEFPSTGGETRFYRVREVMPRWLGFPNEHIMAALQRLTLAEEAAVVSGNGYADGQWTTVATDTGSGFVPWEVSGTEPYPATWTPTLTDYYSLDLTFDNLDITVPPGASINGIECFVKVQNLSDPTESWFEIIDIHLEVPSTTADSADRSGQYTTFFPGTLTERVYGGAADDWGIAWTAGDINTSNIRLHLLAQHWYVRGGDAVCLVVQSKFRVHFTV